MMGGLKILVQALTLFLLGPTCEAASLGLVVHVVPLDSDEGKTQVRAHFSVIAPNPCPQLSGLCAVGEDCLLHSTSLPFTGTKPSGWCVRQWQKTVPSNYSATVTLGSTVNAYVSMKTGPKIRANNGKLNRPPYVALPPPLRARVNCPQHFHLSVMDLDKDKVRCRFASADKGECVNCVQHSFIELNEETCKLAFNGEASAGQYYVVLMVEDMLPLPKMSHVTDNKPLSSIPVHLSLTVEEASSSCSAVPVPTGQTPKHDYNRDVLPFEQVDLTVSFISQLESVLEMAVVGPPNLLRSGLTSAGSITTMNLAWVRSHNTLAPLLPICFSANTNSLQSDPTCLWLYQGNMKTANAEIELKCEQTEMTVVVHVAKLTNISPAKLQLNSPTCPVTYNSTHLTANIPLDGCGTKRVHSGSDLIYTNTLKSVGSSEMISRIPPFILPLACVMSGVQAKGPQFSISIPSETEAFGFVGFWLEMHFPGEGPFANITRNPRFHHLPPGRVQRAAVSPRSKNIGSLIDKLDLHVMSNCTVSQAQLMVGKCMVSETEDFAESQPLMDQGCMGGNSSLEIVTSKGNSRVYRLDLNSIKTQGLMMYLECTVYLCIPTKPSQTCPNTCSSSVLNRAMVDTMLTRTYKVRSAPISRVFTTPAPNGTAMTRPSAAPTVFQANTSHAPEEASAVAVGVIITSISIFLQNIFLD